MEDDLKILKVEYLSNHCMDCLSWVLRGKLEGNSEEISSVALLSPACSSFYQGFVKQIYLSPLLELLLLPPQIDSVPGIRILCSKCAWQNMWKSDIKIHENVTQVIR